jgi:hypothetical protein
MNRHSKNIRPRPVPPACRNAFGRLDAALEQNTPSDNCEKIRLMRLSMFAGVDEYMKTKSDP